ncbi:unnamed protein product, partial [marine sediment metagenome]
MYDYKVNLPPKVIVGTTAETNRYIPEISNAPSPSARLGWLSQFVGIDKMISVEPIMDYDLDTFIGCIRQVFPKFVSIGADSKNNNL